MSDADVAQQAVSDADARFVDRLADDVQAILGVGLLIASRALIRALAKRRLAAAWTRLVAPI